jgi:hypothetical protein
MRPLNVWLIIPLLIGCWRCGSYRTTNGSELLGVRLISSFPLQDTAENVLQTDDVLSVFKIGNHILYQIRVLNTEIKNDKLIKGWVTYQYLIHEKSKNFGMLLEGDSIRRAHVKIDSFLRKNTITNLNAFYRSTKWSDSIIGTEMLPGNIVLLKSIPKKKLDASYCDTTLMYFSKGLNNLPHSLSSDLDEEYQMKFFRIRMIYNADPTNEHKYFRSRREIMFGMEKSDLHDKDEILKQFKLFETLNKASIEGN